MKNTLLAILLSCCYFTGFAGTGATVTVSSAAVSATTVCPATSDVVLYHFTLLETGTPSNPVTAISFTPGGSFISSDLASYKLWKGSVTGSPIGTISTVSTGSGTAVNFTGLSQTVSISTEYYITATIAAAPTDLHTIFVNKMTAVNITTADDVNVDVAIADGGIQTMKSLPAAITGASAMCTGGATLPLGETVTGGTWSGTSTGVASVNPASGVVTPGTSAGSLDVTYTNACGSTSVNVVVNAAPTSITGTKEFCETATSALSVNATGGSWSSTATSVATVNTSGVVSGATEGTSVISYSNGCGAGVAVTVTVDATPTAITGATPICKGGSTLTLGEAAVNGTWSGTATGVASINAATGVVTSGSSAGTLNAAFTNACGSVSVNVVVNGSTPFSITGVKVICEAATSILTVDATGGSWSSGTTSVASVNPAGTVTGILQGTSVISYANGCGSGVGVTVTVDAAPAAIVGSNSLCHGGGTVSETLTNTSSGGTWSSGLPSVASITSAGVVTAHSQGVTTISYDNVCAAPATFTLTINEVPATISGSSNVCTGSNITLSNTSTGGTWTTGDAIVATVDASGVVNGADQGVTTITYDNGCGTAATKGISVNNAPAAIAGPQILCTTSPDVTLSDLSTGGVWTKTGSAIAVNGTTGVLNAISSGFATVTYSNGCGTNATLSLSLNSSAPTGTITNSVANFCTETTSTLSISPAPTHGGVWTSNDETIATVGYTSGTTTALASVTTKQVTFTFDNGCGTKTLSVNVYPTPHVTITGANDSLCNGQTHGAITFTSAVTGTSYNWSNSNTAINTGVVGATGNSISPFTVSNPGNNDVFATILVSPYTSNCSGIDSSTQIIVIPTPAVSVTNDTVCLASHNTIHFFPPTNYTVCTWTNDNTLTNIPGTGTDDFSFTANNPSNGDYVSNITVTPVIGSCNGTPQTLVLVVHPQPRIASLSSAGQNLCNKDAAASTSFSGLTDPLTTYKWTNNDASIGLAASGTGNIATFTTTVTDTFVHNAKIVTTSWIGQCPGYADSFVITVKPTPHIAGITDTAFCNNQKSRLTFHSQPAGASYNWTNSYSPEFQAVNPLFSFISGTTPYLDSFTAINGGTTQLVNTFQLHESLNSCSSDTSFTIAVNPNPQISSPALNALFVYNNLDNVPAGTIVFSGSTDPYTTYDWTNSDPAIGLAASGTGATLDAFVANNPGIADSTATITVLPKIGSCIGSSTFFNVKIRPTSSFAISGATSAPMCNGTTPATININSFNADSVFWTIAYDTLGTAITGTDIATAGATIGLNDTGAKMNSGGAPITFGTSNNPFNAILRATITITPVSASGNGHQQSVSLSIYPTASLHLDTGALIQVDGQTLTYNNTDNSNTVNFLPATDTNGTYTYSWTSSNTLVGLASGSVSAQAYIPSFVATDTFNHDISDIVIVTPYVGGCPGTNNSFTILVHSSANVTANGIIGFYDSLCVGNAIGNSGQQITFTSRVSDSLTTFSWYNLDSTNSVGIPNTGTAINTSNNVATLPLGYTAINPTNQLLSNTIRVISFASGKIGDSTEFVITVRPQPKINPISDKYICNALQLGTIKFSGDTDPLNYYSWTNTNTSVGIHNYDSARAFQIDSFMAVATTDVYNVNTVTVTPIIGNYHACSSAALTFTITVHPNPKLYDGYTSKLNYFCNDSMITDSIHCYTACDTLKYYWKRVDQSGISATTPVSKDSTGNVIYFNELAALHNSNTDSLFVDYKLVLISAYTNGKSCYSTPGDTLALASDTLDIHRSILYPTPRLNVASVVSQLCDSNTFNFTLLSATHGNLNYNWSRVPRYGTNTPDHSFGVSSATNTLISDGLDNLLTDSTRVVTYLDSIIIIRPDGFHCYNIDTNRVDLHPSPKLTVTAVTVCSEDVLNYTMPGQTWQSVLDSTVTANWAVIPSNTKVINMLNATGGSDSISRKLENLYFNKLDSITFNFIMTVKNTGCTSKDTLTAFVKPRPRVPTVSPVSINGSVFDPAKLYNNVRYVNFTDSTDQYGMVNLKYAWSATNAVIWKQSDSTLDASLPNHMNAIVNFPNVGVASLIDTVWYSDANNADTTFHGCAVYDANTYTVKAPIVNSIAGADSIYVLLFSDNNTMVCMNNTVLDSNYSYLWGYDDSATLKPYRLKDSRYGFQINQDLVFDSYLFSEDANKKMTVDSISKYFFWVQTTRKVDTEVYIQKTYYQNVVATHHKGTGTIAGQNIPATLVLYPNPASETLTFKLQDTLNTNLVYHIYDISGKKVLTVNVNDNLVSLSVADLPKGQYFVNCERYGSIIASSRFTKL